LPKTLGGINMEMLSILETLEDLVEKVLLCRFLESVWWTRKKYLRLSKKSG